MGARRVPRHEDDGSLPQSLKTVEMVSAEGTWCCLARSSSRPSSSPTPSETFKSKAHRRLSSEEARRKESQANAGSPSTVVPPETAQEAIYRKLERKKRSCELNKAGEALRNGEIAALLKQGFIARSGAPEKASGSPFKIRISPGRVSPIVDSSSAPISPAAPTFAKLNTLLNSGILGQCSPPPQVDKLRASPTLFEMMAHEQEAQEKAALAGGHHLSSQMKHANLRHASLQETVLLAGSPGSHFNDAASSDVKLTLANREGISVSINLHSEVLAAQSQFFAAKLSDRLTNQPRQSPQNIHLADCDDLDAHIDTFRLMYCRDMRKTLLKENVSRVLRILKVSAAVFFEAGVLSCLEYLEAVPWAEEEEEKVTTLLAQLQLESAGADEVLKRLSTEDSTGSQDILNSLLQLVIKGTDEKARREMKGLISRMLRENVSQQKEFVDLTKENIYDACQDCIESLVHFFKNAMNQDGGTVSATRISEDRCMLMTHIVRNADNLNWLVDILIDRQMADDFVKIWAFQGELAELHAQVPIALGRYEVSRVTARLCMAIGKGQVLAPKDIRFTLLQNWLQPLIEDFGWMQRACKGLDRLLVEEGISQTILTLPLKQQQTIMVAWFDRFLRNGDDCPNLQRAFETWWRRTFVRPQLDPACSSPAQETRRAPHHEKA